MTFCTKCGAEVEDGNKFCTKCGFELEGSDVDEKVGFWTRFWAYIIDIIILQIIGFFLASIGSSGFLLNLIIGASYFTYFFGTTGQTPGKNIMNIKVVSTDGSPMTFSKGFTRWIGYYVSTITLGLGFLWIIWDKDKQGFEDKIAKTYVVKA